MNTSAKQYLEYTRQKECCELQSKKYFISNSCRSCWRCRSCSANGCDITLINNINIVNKKKQRITNAIQGLDTSVVIMSVGQNTRMYYRGDTPVLKWGSKDVPPYAIFKATTISGPCWTIDIGPSTTPMVTSFSLSGKEVPVIITE